LARLAVIDDQLQNGELHLLRLVPLGWIRVGVDAKFEHVPTVFGPVTLNFRLASDPTILRVNFNPSFREYPKRIVLHIPPMEPPLKKVEVNGERIAVSNKFIPIDPSRGILKKL
jgi:hypothetical protein